MRCVPDRVRVEHLGFAALPQAARALFGADAYSTLAWYDCVVRAGLTAGARPVFHLVWQGAALLGVIPMQISAAGAYTAMTTPYTALWSPMLRAGLGQAELVAIGHALGRFWRISALTRLDALDGNSGWLPPLLAGLRRAGLVGLRFDHFGNWHLPVSGLGWDAYLAGRPGQLRSAADRRGRVLMDRKGGRFVLVDSTTGLEAALAAYAQTYAASWKPAEPEPDFIPELARAAANAGLLRLGVLWLGDVPVAAQIWLLHPGGWAGVQKLAHDEAYRALAPGTVLTALMVRHLLQRDGVTELDFGRGDDFYKRSWTGQRRQRTGVILAAPWRVAGAAAIARHAGGRLLGRGSAVSSEVPPVQPE